MVDATGLDALINALIAGFAVMGGSMAGWSGWLAAQIYWTGRSVGVMAEHVNIGLALGFTAGAPAGVAIAIMTLW